MKDTEFVVNAFRKGMSIEEMNGFAHGLSAQYTEGFAHHEGFDAGDLAIVVMKRDVDVEVLTAPMEGESKRPPLSEWPQYVLEINRPRLVEYQYAIGRVWNIAGYVMDWHGCDGHLQITESINELFELVTAVQDVLTNAGIAISVNGEGLNRSVTRAAFVEQIAEVICEQAKNDIGNIRQAAQTLNTALQQANQTIEYLRNEIAVLRKGDASMMTVEDAKTLANVAYNRAKHLPCEDCTQQDFEMWWIEYRKENGFVAQPSNMVSKLDAKSWAYTMYMRAKMRTEREGDACTNDFEWAWNEFCDRKQGQDEPTPSDPIFEGIMSELKEIARGAMGWSDFENAPTPDGNFDAFWTALEKRYDSVPSGESIYIKGTQLEYLESIAKAIIVLNPKKFAPKPKADPITADEVLPRIKALAMKFFGWSKAMLQESLSSIDKSAQLFHTVVADEYELELDIEATNKGLRLFEITRMQYLEKVAQAVADALNK